MPEFSIGFAGKIIIEAEDAETAEALVDSAYELAPVKPGTRPSQRLMVVYALPVPDPAAPKAEVVN